MGATEDTDEELLRRATKDPAAFGAFYVRRERLVLRYFARHERDPEIIADLTSETFAAALAGAGRFDDERGSALNWLMGIARHVLLASWRHGRVESDARQQLGMQPIALTDEQNEALGRLAVDDLLDQLGDAERAAVAGRVIQGQAYAELATQLQCSEQVVRQRVSRGLTRLRHLLSSR